MTEWIVIGVLGLGCMALGWLYLGARAKIARIKKMKHNIDEMTAVIHDMNALGGGLVEIKRVDPSSVFLYSP